MRQVAPCILVSDDVTIAVAHPDPCWIIRDPADTASMSGGGMLYVFSSPEQAEEYIVATSLEEAAITGPINWDDLVDRFGHTFSEVLIDHKGDRGFYGTAPLIKGI